MNFCELIMKGYLINLDAEQNRLNSSIQEANKISIEIVRIAAIDAKTLTNSSLVTNGVQAAWKSHLKAIQTFLSTNDTHAIILEDDFKLDDKKEFQKFISSGMYLHWDMIQFGFLTTGFDTFLKVWQANFENSVFRVIHLLFNNRFWDFPKIKNKLRVRKASESPRGYIPDDCQPGAHFYLINRRFAQAILELNDPQFLSIDDFYVALSKMRIFKILRSRTSLASQKPFPSWEGNRFING